jgi:hypothetical protein
MGRTLAVVCEIGESQFQQLTVNPRRTPIKRLTRESWRNFLEAQTRRLILAVSPSLVFRQQPGEIRLYRRIAFARRGF